LTQPTTRVLYLIGGRRIGGTETHVVRLAATLRENYRCLVCCLDPSPEYSSMLSDAGIEHVNLRLPSLASSAALSRYVDFERCVERFRPDLVHSYSFAGDILGAVLRARGCAARLLTSRRGEDTSRRHQRIRRVTNRCASRIVCVSSEIAQFVEATEHPGPDQIEVIPNGVPDRLIASQHAASARRALRFGTLGTVKPIKGTDLLVDAFLAFAPGLAVELVVAGLIDRPWATDLQTRAASDARITFLGRASEPDAFLAGLDVFVLPSRSEGMSNALLEAMAIGLPCIATDVGSNRSVLQPPGSAAGGIVCAPSSDALRAAMSELAGDAGAQRRYGSRAREIIREHYTIDAMVDRYEQLYSTAAL